jgi:hypothetical protein
MTKIAALGGTSLHKGNQRHGDHVTRGKARLEPSVEIVDRHETTAEGASHKVLWHTSLC